MSKRKTKPRFLPDLTVPTHKDLEVKAKTEAKVTKGKTSDRITSDTPPVISETEFADLLLKYKTKSAMIRALAAESIPINMISHTLLFYGVLSPRSAYQHVYNVLGQPLKRPKKQEPGETK